MLLLSFVLMLVHFIIFCLVFQIIFAMPSFDPLGLAYGLLVSGGGIYGYARSGSVPSIVAGVSFGLLAIAGSMQLAHDPKNIWILLASRDESSKSFLKNGKNIYRITFFISSIVTFFVFLIFLP